MEMKHPHVRTIPLKCAPSQAPCPTCGEPGKRKDVLHRHVRTIAYKQVVYLDITYGEYRARCDCCTTFRATPPGVEPRALYDKGFAGRVDLGGRPPRPTQPIARTLIVERLRLRAKKDEIEGPDKPDFRPVTRNSGEWRENSGQ